MRKTLWFGLTVVPLAILGATWWVQRAAWERMEDSYRREIATRAVKWSGLPGLEVTVTHRDGIPHTPGSSTYQFRLGSWNRKELQTIVPEIQLVRQPPGAGRVEDVNCLYFLGKDHRFVVSLDRDRGEILKSGDRQSDELRSLALSPETCRAVKRRVLSRWGDKIAASQRKFQSPTTHQLK